jgi:hypothetical protein
MFHDAHPRQRFILTVIYRNIFGVARPQKITDEAILVIIRELSLPHRSPSGTAVRQELHTRFGIRAGTERIYRLLKSPPPPSSPVDLSSATDQIAELTRERDAARQRAELAEYRERATQDRTALQIDDLRQRLKALGVDPYR